MARSVELPPEVHGGGGVVTYTAPGSHELADILDRLVGDVSGLLEVQSCSVALLDEDTGDLVTWSALGGGPNGPRGTRFRPNEGVAGWVAAHVAPVLIDDVALDNRFKRLDAEPKGSMMCVPLVDGDQVLGTLTVASARPAAFDQRRQRMVEALANQAVLAITKARQAEEAGRQADELRALLSAATALTSSLDTQTFFGHIVASIRQVAPCDDAVIYAYHEPTRELKVAAGLGRRVERLSSASIALDDVHSIAAKVARDRHGALVPPGPMTAGEVTETFLSGDPLALLSVPLVSKERLRGVITLARASAFNRTELRVMLHLATIVAAALENVELYRAARTEREQMAAIFAAGSDGMAIVDANLNVLDANEAYGRLFGLARGQMVGQRCCAALSRTGGVCALCEGECLVAKAIETGMAVPHVDCQIDATGLGMDNAAAETPAGRPSHPPAPPSPVRYVDLSITPVNVPAGRRALLIGRDVTALRAMEIMKDNFLSMVSHELNAPLQAIGGYLHVVLDGMAGDLNTQQRDFLRRVRVSSEHLKVMVQDLLLITRRDAGQFELMRTPTRVAEVFAEVLDEIELIANDAGVDLSILCDPDLPVIPADHTRLVQVVRNLITNAVKFTPEGGKVALRGAYDERSVRITVSDTGIGIPPEHQRRIFDRFYQVYTDGERSRGQGLGLAIVKIIVEGHGGTINVWSAPGQGSAFTVLLPRRVPPSVAAAPEFLRV